MFKIRVTHHLITILACIICISVGTSSCTDSEQQERPAPVTDAGDRDTEMQGADTIRDTSDTSDTQTRDAVGDAFDQAPVVTFRNPGSEAMIEGTTTVEIEVTDDGEVQSVLLSTVQYGEIGLMTPSEDEDDIWTLNWTPEPSQEGAITLRAIAIDDAGQTSRATRNLVFECPERGCPCNYLERSNGVCTEQIFDETSGNCTRPDAFEASEQSCDGKDNDCDGVSDEGCPCQYNGRDAGVCNVSITISGMCPEPDAYEQKESSCDQKDNDCNGIQDEWDQGCNSYRLLGSPGTDQINGLAAGASDRIYAAGVARGTLANTTPEGLSDGFVATYDAQGRVVQTTIIGSAEQDFLRDIVRDTSDRLYVAGTTYGVLKPGNTNERRDGFVARLTDQGQMDWLKQVGGQGVQALNDIAIDSENNIYVVGKISTDFRNQTNAGRNDGWVVKFNAQGTLQWTRLIGTPEQDIVTSVALDSNDTLYFGGRTRGDLDTSGRSSSSGWEAFIARFDTSGQRQWIRTLGEARDDLGTQVAAGDSNVYLAGHTFSSLGDETNQGKSDVFITQYDSQGNRTWLEMVGSAERERAQAATYDSSRGVLIGGRTLGSVTSTPNAGTRDGFIVGFDEQGGRTQEYTVAYPGSDRVRALTISAGQRLFAGGQTSSRIEERELEGESDAFVVPLN